jgi:hypothetical protein
VLNLERTLFAAITHAPASTSGFIYSPLPLDKKGHGIAVAPSQSRFLFTLWRQ